MGGLETVLEEQTKLREKLKHLDQSGDIFKQEQVAKGLVLNFTFNGRFRNGFWASKHLQFNLNQLGQKPINLGPINHQNFVQKANSSAQNGLRTRGETGRGFSVEGVRLKAQKNRQNFVRN